MIIIQFLPEDFQGSVKVRDKTVTLRKAIYLFLELWNAEKISLWKTFTKAVSNVGSIFKEDDALSNGGGKRIQKPGHDESVASLPE